MPIVALGYMGIRSQALADWSDYAGRLLGMQKVDSGGGSMAFRTVSYTHLTLPTMRTV